MPCLSVEKLQEGESKEMKRKTTNYFKESFFSFITFGILCLGPTCGIVPGATAGMGTRAGAGVGVRTGVGAVLGVRGRGRGY